MSGRSPLFRGATTVVVPRTAAQGGGVSKQSLETSHHEDTIRATDVDTPEKLALQLNRLQRLAGNNTRGARTLPFNGGTYWPSQTLVANTTNSFAHGCNGPAAFLSARVRPTANVAPVIVEVGQTSDGRIQLATTANCIADLFFYPQPGLTNLGQTTQLAPPFPPSVTPVQTAGGGASTIGIGLFASRPATGVAGQVYISTDAANGFAVNDGSKWRPMIGGTVPGIQPPLAATFTPVNQGASTLVDSNGTLLYSGVNDSGTVTFRGYVQAWPAGVTNTNTVDTSLTQVSTTSTGSVAGFPSFALVMRESATGKMLQVELLVDTDLNSLGFPTPYIMATSTWTNNTTRTPTNYTLPDAAAGSPVFFRLRRATAFIFVEMSHDRNVWVQAGNSFAVGSVFTTAPDQYGIGGFGQQTQPIGQVMHLVAS